MQSYESDPLLVTLRFDEPSFRRFQSERRQHFPAARNIVPAHLSLFHKLPGEEIGTIAAGLRDATKGQRGAIPLAITGLRFLGYGTAYTIASPALDTLRADLARRWSGWLTTQDAQRFSAHVTIQNKAPAGEAKALHSALKTAFVPFAAEATGLLLWHYRGGPWEPAGAFPFDEPET